MPLRNVSPSSAAILRSVIAAIRPRGHGFDQPIDEDVLSEIDRTLPCLPASSRLGLMAGLRLLDWGGPVISGRLTRLTRMSREQARDCLRRRLERRLPL